MHTKHLSCIASLGLATLLLAGCASSGASRPEPAPLPELSSAVQMQSIWRAQAHASDTFRRFGPQLVAGQPLLFGKSDQLQWLDGQSGAQLRSFALPKGELTGAYAASDELVVVVLAGGHVQAYRPGAPQAPLWQVSASADVVAAPVIAGGLVLVRSVEGRVAAYDVADGKLRWFYQRQSSTLQLRSFASPLVDGSTVFLGLPGGRLVALSLADGKVRWETQLALPKGSAEIERLVDVAAAPVLAGNSLCAVAYQGRVACYDARNGAQLWGKDASSWAGLAGDSKAVYLVDEQGVVSAYDRAGGQSLWRQEALRHRKLTTPLLQNGKLIIGDDEGNLLVLSGEDGRLLAHRALGDGVIDAPALPLSGKAFLVQAQDGAVQAFEFK